jgi:hypothetical protein
LLSPVAAGSDRSPTGAGSDWTIDMKEYRFPASSTVTKAGRWLKSTSFTIFRIPPSAAERISLPPGPA